MLPEDKRKQLDGIVQQMVQNKEPDDNIRFVVDDFKKKYTPAETPQTEQPKIPLLTPGKGNFGNAIKDVAVGAGKGFLRGAVDLAGLAQKGGKAILGGLGADTSQMGLKGLDSSTPEGMGVQNSLASKSRGEQIGGILETAGELGTGFVKSGAQKLVKSGLEARQAQKVLQQTAKQDTKLAETIAPELTRKEAKLAKQQGRFFEGKEPTLFRAGTPDRIATSQKTFDAVQTIKNNIPNAHKMSPSNLYVAVKDKIGNIATALKPEMQKTPIKPETIQKINQDWRILKSKQLEMADATDEMNIVKWQKQFEQKLQNSGNQSQNDLWEARQAYDDSIPSSVKKANSMSPESLQKKKEIWLQNREILNSAINDTTHGMGSMSQKAFSDMSNLYDAMNNLLAKTKPNKTGQASKAREFIRRNRGYINTAIGGGVVTGGIMKVLD